MMQYWVYSRFFRASIGAVLAVTMAGSALAASPDTVSVGPHAATVRVAADTTGSTATQSGGSDPAPSRNAARSRMRECGHQWSSMKKSGAANGMTWKDFSQGCLAKQ